MIKKLGLDRFSALYLWAFFMLYFGLTRHDTFLTSATLKLVLQENVITGVLALAFLIPLVTGTFDLSIGTQMTLSLAITAKLAQHGTMSPYASMWLAIAACGFAGFVSGFFVVKLRVNSFIATLGMSQVLTAICLRISTQQISNVYSSSYQNIGKFKFLGQPAFVWYLLILSVIAWYVLEHTPVGRYMFATGGNPEAARLAGVRTDRYVWGSLVVSGMIAGFAGIVFTWKVGIYGINNGPSNLFPAVAAVFFGASQLKGRANVWGTMIALLSLAWGIKGLQLTFATNTVWIEPLFTGLALLAAVALASYNGVVKVKKNKTKKSDAPAAAEPAAVAPAGS